MGGFESIAAVGKTLERRLNAGFVEAEPVATSPTRAALVRTEDFTPADTTSTVLTFPALTIYLLRVDRNGSTRAAWSAVGGRTGRVHLPLDLSYLLTAWASNAEHEHLVIGRTLQILEAQPNLSGPQLYPSTSWEANEGIQVIPADLSAEDVLRTFDALPVDYRVSLAYVARIVRIDGPGSPTGRPVETVVTGLTASTNPDPDPVFS
jgi:hypothetical protein